MSINLIIGNALSALQTNQTALRTTSNNIANVNTEDYARREVILTSNYAGTDGAGVDIAEVRRIVNEFFQKEVYSATTDAGYYTAQTEFFDRLQTLLGNPDSGTSIAAQITEVIASFSDVAIDPTSAPRRLDLISDLERMANTVSLLSDQIQGLRADTDLRMIENVATINTLTATIYDLNPKIQKSLLQGGDAGALLDQRDAAIRELSNLLDISVTAGANGAINVSTKSGVTLVGVTLFELQYNGGSAVSAETIFNDVTIHRMHPSTGVVEPVGNAFTHHLTGGEMAGLLDMRDKVLPEMAEELGSLVATLIDGFNAIHNENTAVPAPSVMTGINTGLHADDNLNFTGKTTLAVVDASGVLVKRVEIDFDAFTYSVNGGATVWLGNTPGTIAIALNTALGGDGTVTFSNGVMQLSAQNAGDGLAFLEDTVSPSDRGGRTFSHFFGLNNLLEADQPSHFDTGLLPVDFHQFGGGETIDISIRGERGNILTNYTYTMTAGEKFSDIITDLNDVSTGLGTYYTFALDAQGQLNVTPKPGYEGADLQVGNDATSRGTTGKSFSQLFGLGDRFIAEQASGVKVTDRVTNDAMAMALAKLELPLGVVVGDLVLSESDSRGAQALQGLQNIHFSFDAAGALNATTATIGEYSALFLADAGQRTARADAFSENSQALLAEVEARNANLSGVSLDEELSNMMIYQQAYNAAARMVQTASELYDTLLSIV